MLGPKGAGPLGPLVHAQKIQEPPAGSNIVAIQKPNTHKIYNETSTLWSCFICAKLRRTQGADRFVRFLDGHHIENIMPWIVAQALVIVYWLLIILIIYQCWYDDRWLVSDILDCWVYWLLASECRILLRTCIIQDWAQYCRWLVIHIGCGVYWLLSIG